MDGRFRLVGVALLAGACGHPAPAPVAPSNRPPPPPVVTPPPTGALLAWPVPRFTAAQLAELHGCPFDDLGAKRYPKELAADALAAAFAPQDTCDHAVLAAACAARLEEDAKPPPACLDAYRHAVQANPAFAFANQLTGPYFGQVVLVPPPPAAQKKLASVVLDYDWTGLGTEVKWTLTASDLAGSPALDATGPDKKPVSWSPEVSAIVATMPASLNSFLPVAKGVKAIACTDNYPAWTATLTFTDGSKLELTTNGSNLLGLGGPWQTTIDGAMYLQLSPDFVRAVGKLVKALALPIGEPMGETCGGFDLQAEALGG